MTNLEKWDGGGRPLPADPALATMAERMAEAMEAMGTLLRATNERMAALEAEVRRLRKVTPAQAAEINRAIRDRAAELCRAYRCPGQEKAAAAAIRRAVKDSCGVSAIRETAACDRETALLAVRMWDDYRGMKALRERGRSHGG